MHILVRDKLVDRDYIAAHTTGFDRLEAEVLPRFFPQHVAEIAGLTVGDVERLAALYGAAKRSFIRLGEGMTRLARGGEALRAVALLPGVTGAYGRRGGGALLLTVPVYELQFRRDPQPYRRGRRRDAHRQSSAAGRRAPSPQGATDPRAVHRRQQPGGDQSRRRQGA